MINKGLIISILSLVVCFVASCTKREEIFEHKEFILSAGVGGNAQSKVYLGDDTQSSTKVYWSDDESDTFDVVGKGGVYTFKKDGFTEQSSVANFKLISPSGVDALPDGSYSTHYPKYYSYDSPIDYNIYREQSGKHEDIKELYMMEGAFRITGGVQEKSLIFYPTVAVFKIKVKRERYKNNAISVTFKADNLISSGFTSEQNSITTKAPIAATAEGAAEVYFVVPFGATEDESYCTKTISNIKVLVSCGGVVDEYTFGTMEREIYSGSLYRINKDISAPDGHSLHAIYYYVDDIYEVYTLEGFKDVVDCINGTNTPENAEHITVINTPVGGEQFRILIKNNISFNTAGITVDENTLKPSGTNYTAIKDLGNFKIDGGGYTISGLRRVVKGSTLEQDFGLLVDKASSGCTNLTIDDAVLYVESSYNNEFLNVGGIIGRVYDIDEAISDWRPAKAFNNCKVTNSCFVTVNGVKSVNVGGVVGMTNVSIASCISNAKVQVKECGQSYIGGVVGKCEAHIYNSKASGTITSYNNKENVLIGGIASFMVEKTHVAHGCSSDVEFLLYVNNVHAGVEKKELNLGCLFGRFGSGMGIRRAIIHNCKTLKSNTSIKIYGDNKPQASQSVDVKVSGIVAQTQFATIALSSCEYNLNNIVTDGYTMNAAKLFCYDCLPGTTFHCYSSCGYGSADESTAFGFDINSNTTFSIGNSCDNDIFDIVKLNSGYEEFKETLNALELKLLNNANYKWVSPLGIFPRVVAN